MKLIGDKTVYLLTSVWGAVVPAPARTASKAAAMGRLLCRARAFAMGVGFPLVILLSEVVLYYLVSCNAALPLLVAALEPLSRLVGVA